MVDGMEWNVNRQHLSERSPHPIRVLPEWKPAQLVWVSNEQLAISRNKKVPAFDADVVPDIARTGEQLNMRLRDYW
jgi:hypothetical protein